MKLSSSLICPYCNSTSFALRSDGTANCKKCTLTVGYNNIDKEWGLIFEEDGEPIFVNENIKFNRDLKLGLNLLDEYLDFSEEK